MTVKQFYDLYRQMTVPLINGQRVFGVDVHRYRNAGKVSAPLQVTAGLDAWADLRRQIMRIGISLGPHRYKVDFTLVRPVTAGFSGPSLAVHTEIVDIQGLGTAFIGKGTPAVIQQVLRLAAAFGIVKPDSASMTNYCESDIGLDCSGFVGNYLREEQLGTTSIDTPSTAFAPQPQRIGKLAQIQARSVLVWTPEHHVAIVDGVCLGPHKNNEVHAWVAESAAAKLVPGDLHTNGLNYSQYVFKAADAQGKFTIHRGVGGGRKAWHVWIANY